MLVNCIAFLILLKCILSVTDLSAHTFVDSEANFGSDPLPTATGWTSGIPLVTFAKQARVLLFVEGRKGFYSGYGGYIPWAIASTTDNKGRILAYGHKKYAEKDTNFAASVFYQSSETWLCKNTQACKIGVDDDSLLAKYSGSIIIETITDASLSSIDVLVLVDVRSITDENSWKAIQDHVQNGGGLLIAQSRESNKAGCQYSNQFLGEVAGFAFGCNHRLWNKNEGYPIPLKNSGVDEKIVNLGIMLTTLEQIIVTYNDINITEVYSDPSELMVFYFYFGEDANQGMFRDLPNSIKATLATRLKTIATSGHCYTTYLLPENFPAKDTSVTAICLHLAHGAATLAPVDQVIASPDHILFPGVAGGDVTLSNAENVNIIIETSIPKWHNTGYYAQPGKVIIAIIPEDMLAIGFALRIGGHPDVHFTRTKWPRSPYSMSVVVPIESNPTKVATSHGGMIYVDIPSSLTKRDGESAVNPVRLQLELQNVVRSPMFVANVTTKNEWDSLREDCQKNVGCKAPGPFMDMVMPGISISIPSYNVRWRTFTQMQEASKFWGDMVRYFGYQRGLPVTGEGERISNDVHAAYGLAYASYPCVGPMPKEQGFWSAEYMVDMGYMLAKGDWMWFHEVGHRFESGNGQGPHKKGSWQVFKSNTDVFNNYLICYSYHRMGITSNQRCQLDEYMKDMTPLTEAPTLWGSQSYWTRLEFWKQLSGANHGYENLRQAHLRGYAIPQVSEKHDRLLMFTSMQFERDMTPMFERWGIEKSDSYDPTLDWFWFGAPLIFLHSGKDQVSKKTVTFSGTTEIIGPYNKYKGWEFSATSIGSWANSPHTFPDAYSDITISLWVNLDKYVPWAGFLSRENSWGFGLDQSGKKLAFLGADNTATVSAGSVLPLNEWIHVAIVLHWCNRELIFYVNGVEESSKSDVNEKSLVGVNGGDVLSVGVFMSKADANKEEGHLVGKLISVALYSRALKPSTILGQYRSITEATSPIFFLPPFVPPGLLQPYEVEGCSTFPSQVLACHKPSNTVECQACMGSICSGGPVPSGGSDACKDPCSVDDFSLHPNAKANNRGICMCGSIPCSAPFLARSTKGSSCTSTSEWANLMSVSLRLKSDANPDSFAVNLANQLSVPTWRVYLVRVVNEPSSQLIKLAFLPLPGKPDSAQEIGNQLISVVRKYIAFEEVGILGTDLGSQLYTTDTMLEKFIDREYGRFLVTCVGGTYSLDTQGCSLGVGTFPPTSSPKITSSPTPMPITDASKRPIGVYFDDPSAPTSNGITGSILFDPLNVIIELSNVPAEAHVLSVHSLPLDGRSCLGVGEMFPKGSDLGDLSRLGVLSDMVKAGNIRRTIPQPIGKRLELNGRNSIVGRSVIIFNAAQPPRAIACGTITFGGKTISVQGNFSHDMMGGIIMTQLKGKPTADTTILITIGHSAIEQDSEGTTNSTNTTISTTLKILGGESTHLWHVHVNPIDLSIGEKSRCASTGGHFDPLNMYNDDYATSCTINTPSKCELGDLAGKHGKLISHGRLTRILYTDPHLPLQGPNSITGRSVVIHGGYAGRWVEIDPIRACESNSDGITRTSYSTNKIDLESCQAACQAKEGCIAVDYYDTRWCNFYDKACTSPTRGGGGSYRYDTDDTVKWDCITLDLIPEPVEPTEQPTEQSTEPANIGFNSFGRFSFSFAIPLVLSWI